VLRFFKRVFIAWLGGLAIILLAMALEFSNADSIARVGYYILRPIHILTQWIAEATGPTAFGRTAVYEYLFQFLPYLDRLIFGSIIYGGLVFAAMRLRVRNRTSAV
jgi:hypothetical protein